MGENINTEDIQIVKKEPIPQLSVVWPRPGETIQSDLTDNTYIFGQQIGEGNFSYVYACEDVWKNELAAKVLKPKGQSFEKVGFKANDEVQKLILLRHPNIVYIHDAFLFRNTFYIVTERCGGPISEILNFEFYDYKTWLMPIARCLLQAVNFIHLNNYIHHDIHLGNVFYAFVKDEVLSSDKARSIVFKLGDLGISKLKDEISQRNTWAQWMLPPEVLKPDKFGPIDHRVDIYHSGLLLLQIANAGKLQFTEEEILSGRPRKIALTLPTPLNVAIEKALRRHVMYRTENAMEFWRDLNGPSIEKDDLPLLLSSIEPSANN